MVTGERKSAPTRRRDSLFANRVSAITQVIVWRVLDALVTGVLAIAAVALVTMGALALLGWEVPRW